MRGKQNDGFMENSCEGKRVGHELSAVAHVSWCVPHVVRMSDQDGVQTASTRAMLRQQLVGKPYGVNDTQCAPLWCYNGNLFSTC